MRKKILVVEDDLGPRESFRMILKPFYNVSTAEDGSEGLQKIKEAAQPYDLIITGIKMHGMNGDEMVSLFRETDTETPILVITGGCYERGCQLVKEGLVSACFDKPYNLDEVKSMVELLLTDTRGTC
jgi:two-component system response regulator PilR (NtrC family)